jgi:hypothetical protein
LEKDALDRTMWRARFGRDFGPVVRGTTVVCFLGVPTLCGCIFYSSIAGFSLLVFEVS